MNEEICCITNKRKTTKNEWENVNSMTFYELYAVYIKKLGLFFFYIYFTRQLV